jgi:hypothetical protein
VTPDCIAFFGLTWPCTEQELNRAYRRLSLKFHPDVGGDEAASKVVNRMYEQAKEYIRSGTVPPPQAPPKPPPTRTYSPPPPPPPKPPPSSTTGSRRRARTSAPPPPPPPKPGPPPYRPPHTVKDWFTALTAYLHVTAKLQRSISYAGTVLASYQMKETANPVVQRGLEGYLADMRAWLQGHATPAEQEFGERAALIMKAYVGSFAPSPRTVQQIKANDHLRDLAVGLMAEGPWLYEADWKRQMLTRAIQKGEYGLVFFAGCISPLAIGTFIAWAVLMVLTQAVGIPHATAFNVSGIGVVVLMAALGPLLKFQRYQELRAGSVTSQLRG